MEVTRAPALERSEGNWILKRGIIGASLTFRNKDVRTVHVSAELLQSFFVGSDMPSSLKIVVNCAQKVLFLQGCFSVMPKLKVLHVLGAGMNLQGNCFDGCVEMEGIAFKRYCNMCLPRLTESIKKPILRGARCRCIDFRVHRKSFCRKLWPKETLSGSRWF